MRCALLAKTGEKKWQRWPRLLAWARLGLAGVAFGLALLTLRHIPHRARKRRQALFLYLTTAAARGVALGSAGPVAGL